MKRNRRAIVVALLVVVAIGLAAATLTNPTSTAPGSGSGLGSGSGVGTGNGDAGSDGQDTGVQPGGAPISLDIGFCIPFLTSDLFVLLAVLALVTAAALIRWRTNTLIAVVMLVAFLPPLLILHALFTKCGTSMRTPTGNFSPVDISNQTLPFTGGNAGGAAQAVTSPPFLLVAVLVVAVVLFLLFVRGSGDDDETEEPPEATEDESLGGLAAAAGTAADRIESEEDVENAVYRAWRDMTGHLDTASPETTTPAEFAAAARDAGMQPEHVDTLTALFREVRYGGEPVTDERERRALDALRDIEAAYGTEEDE